MSKLKTTTATSGNISRPPIVVVMGHIDHGKSTLLDYIRKSNVVEKEAGGITQHISAYEVTHKNDKGEEKRITFLDTPGHEAFQKMRFRGAEIADIAILVVSAEDGVKAQTLEAIECINKSAIPFIVAINKIDKPNADVERTKLALLEHGVYLEGMGGQISFIPISAKQGTGIPELLDMMLLQAELEELTGNTEKLAEGVIIESNLDPKKGISATLIIRDGSIEKGMFVAAGSAVAPVRIMEDFKGAQIEKSTFSSPIRIVGWSSIPAAGAAFGTFATKKDAEQVAALATPTTRGTIVQTIADETAAGKTVIPVILKADVIGSLDAIEHELEKLGTEQVRLRVIQKNVGSISENDVKVASGVEGTLVVGFNAKIDSPARDLAERTRVEIQTFDIIYKLSEWLAEIVAARAPKVETEEVIGRAKVLKYFSSVKDKHVLGARMESGTLKNKSAVRIIRKEIEVSRGHITSLQQNKIAEGKVEQGEFGAQIQSKIEPMPGDYLEAIAHSTT